MDRDKFILNIIIRIMEIKMLLNKIIEIQRQIKDFSTRLLISLDLQAVMSLR